METQGYRFEYRRSEVRGQWVFFWRAAEHSELWCDIFGPDVLVLVVCSSVFAFSLTSLWRPLSLLHQTYLQNGLKNYLKLKKKFKLKKNYLKLIKTPAYVDIGSYQK